MADEKHKLQVEVLTPEGEVFSGEVRQLSTRTGVGEIGVLANHVPILARLRPTELRLHLGEGESDTQRYAQAEGWLQVFANHAKVLVGECHKPEDLDTGELQEKLKDAEARISDSEEDSAARSLAERDKERAEVFLQVAGASK